MSQRRTVSGRRSILVWLALVLLLVLAVALAAVVFIIGPQQQLRQQARVTAAARQAEVERLYAVGVAFEKAGDCRQAAELFAQVISLEPGYKDAQSHLAEGRACQQAVEATATAQAIAMAQATTEAQATATADARALAQAAAATATAAAEASAARATAETAAAIEAAYQRGLGYYNLERWAEAQTAFEEVFALAPTYKDVQAKLAKVGAKVAEVQKMTPTVTPHAEGPPWWDASYTSRQQLTIGNNADTPLPLGYSVKLDLTGEKAIDCFRQSASTQPGDDVRIAYWDALQWQEMDRYVESFTSTDIRLWFATQDEIPPNGVSRDYWVYFGSTEAGDPPADPLKVFLWWDDFHTNTVSRYAVFRHEGSWGSKGGWHKGSMSVESTHILTQIWPWFSGLCLVIGQTSPDSSSSDFI